MHIKQVWGAAFILTACLWVGWASPAAAQLFGINLNPAPAPAAAPPAAAPDKPLVLKKYTKRRSRSSRHKKANHAANAPVDRPADDKRQAKDGDASDAPEAARADTKPETAKSKTAKPAAAVAATAAASSPAWPAISSSVANARAELVGGSADGNAVFNNKPATTSDTATTPQAADAAPTVTAAPAMDKAAASGPALASADSAAPLQLMSAVVQSEEVASNSETPWSRTSLIGKIFVAFGGLLMLASAARLYIG